MILAVFIALVVLFVVLPLVWNIFWAVVGAVIAGLVFGALGRLIVPGHNPIGFLATVACGWVGSLVGLAIARGIDSGWFVTVLLEAGAAAGAVAIWSGTHRSAIGSGRRPIARGRF